MRQGIIIFAESPATAPAKAALKATVEAALAVEGATPFLAYAKADDSGPLRKLVGGPPPRFFPQANRATLGERLAQSLAFLFVQDFDRVVIVTGPMAHLGPEALAALLETLEDEAVAIAAEEGAYLLALRREDFPRVAPIFEDVAWEREGAKAEAERLLSENGAKA